MKAPRAPSLRRRLLAGILLPVLRYHIGAATGPAMRGSETGKPTARYDIRQALPPDLRPSYPV